MDAPPLVLVSNRGPVTFGPDGEVRRGTGGLVTALTGLASHREVTWIASAMTDEDIEAAERNEGRPFTVKAPDGGDYRVKLVASDPIAYDRFYNIIANPMLWFIQHYLWDLSNAPGHPPQRDRGIRVRVQRRQRGPREGRAGGDRGDRGPDRDGPRLPPLHASRD